MEFQSAHSKEQAANASSKVSINSDVECLDENSMSQFVIVTETSKTRKPNNQNDKEDLDNLELWR
jgi:hypothetical protein